MSIIIPANSAVGGGGLATNSLRFNKASSDSLTRTPSSNGSKTTNTISFWLKRSLFSGGTDQRLFSQLYTGGSGNPDDYISFDNVDRINFQFYGNGSSGVNNGYLVTNRVFRDNAAWYHIVAVQDTTNGTSGDRLRLYINGVRETSFSTENYPSQNTQGGAINNTSYPLFIGQRGNSAGYFDGYMAEYCFIDGQALAPTSFGEFNGDSGVWNPIDVSGLTFGTNGFYLQFEESGTGTNASGMGADTSGNDNHFAVNNLTAIDQTTDTCTNNFATLNSLDGFLGNSTFSEGNLRFNTETAGNVTWARSTQGMTSGKFYFEAFLQTAADHNYIGISDRASPSISGTYFGDGAYDYGYKSSNGQKKNNSSSSSYGNTYTTNDTVMCAVDLDNLKVYFGKNGTWQNSGNPASGSTGTGAAFTITAPSSTNSGDYFFCVADGTTTNNSRWICNFGNPPYAISSGNADSNGYGNFEYAVPSGYLSLNTKNLSEVLS